MTENKERCESGNKDLLLMFESKNFNASLATHIIADIFDINEPILDLSGYATTYLFEAQTYNNVEAVRFLLENGADPNLIIPWIINDCALYDLHFLWKEMVGEEEKRLEIVKLFYEFGGDPNLPYEMETLFGHVMCEVFDVANEVHDWEYLKKFFVISLAYGGYKNTNLIEPIHLLEPIDIDCIDEYDFKLVKCKDSSNVEGHLLNPDGMVIAII